MVDAVQMVEADDVLAHLRWDSRIDAANIRVVVQDGHHVILRGSVPTYLDRKAASDDAWRISGVRSVTNELVVKLPGDFSIPTDSEIQMRIVQAINWHPTIDASDVHIAVERGHVALDGHVGSYWQKMVVEEFVANTSGVVSITNRLAVVPKENAADEATARDIIDALRRSDQVDADTVNIKVKDGHVTLTGHVPNADAYRVVHNTAIYTFGVIDVNNRLVID